MDGRQVTIVLLRFSSEQSRLLVLADHIEQRRIPMAELGLQIGI